MAKKTNHRDETDEVQRRLVASGVLKVEEVDAEEGKRGVTVVLAHKPARPAIYYVHLLHPEQHNRSRYIFSNSRPPLTTTNEDEKAKNKLEQEHGYRFCFVSRGDSKCFSLVLSLLSICIRMILSLPLLLH